MQACPWRRGSGVTLGHIDPAMADHFVRFAHPEGVEVPVSQPPVTWDGGWLPLARTPHPRA